MKIYHLPDWKRKQDKKALPVYALCGQLVQGPKQWFAWRSVDINCDKCKEMSKNQ